MRRHAAIAAAALGVLFVPATASAADPVVTGFVVKAPLIDAGTPASFQIGVTPSDGTTWTASSVSVSVTLTAADGTVAARSPSVSPGGDIQPGQSAFVFVDITLAPQVTGTFVARAFVTHDGSVVAATDPVSVAVGTVVAAAAAPNAGAPHSAQFSSNEAFAARSAQSGTLQLSGTYGGGKSYQTNLGLASTPGAQKPIVNVQTQNALTQIGTFAPSFDPLVLSGVTGDGVAVKRNYGARTLALTAISGAHATANPFSLEAVSYALPLVANWTVTTTLGYEHVDGDVAGGAAFFMRSGDLAGITLARAPDPHGFAYALRYGTVAYDDAVSGAWRTDRAVEGTIAFPILRSKWTVDVLRAGPYFPNLSSPGVTPDRESESLTGTIPVGAVTVTAGVNGYRDALNGSTSLQKTHVYTEKLGATTALHDGDTLGLDLSTADQHRYADTSLASLNDNVALTYNAVRGVTTYSLVLGDANLLDNTGTAQHTMQESFTVTRAFGRGLTLSTGVNFTGNHAAVMSGTSLLQALVSTLSYVRGDLTFTSSLNRATTIPYLGTAPEPVTSLNYGVTFKPAKSRTSLQGTVTQNHGGGSASTGSLNLSRQF